MSQSTLRSCPLHATENGCSIPDCTDLHLCRVYLEGGECKFGKKCKFGHSLLDPHNQRSLRINKVTDSDICTVRKLVNAQSSKTRFPWICKFYNSALSACKHGQDGCGCTAMHICLHYAKGDCIMGKKCKRQHDIFAPQPKALLQKHGIDINNKPELILKQLRNSLQNTDKDNSEETEETKGELSRGGLLSTKYCPASEKKDPSCWANTRERKVSSCSESADNDEEDDDKKQNDAAFICTYNLTEAGCLYKDNCNKVHSSRTFQWQYLSQEGDYCRWQNFDDESNKEIEFNYADPQREQCLSTSTDLREFSPFKIKFDEMNVYWFQSFGSTRVRRLSTQSLIAVSPVHERFATRWCWYWQDEHDHWQQYRQVDEHDDTISEALEKAYVVERSRQFVFKAAGQRYTVDFTNMIQENTDSGGKKVPIRRRPVIFQGIDDLDKMPVVLLTPDYWHLFISDNLRSYQRFMVERKGKTAEEFRKIQLRFHETMPCNEWRIESVERIQNLKLWKCYLRTRKWMEQQHRGENGEMLLFYCGTEEYWNVIFSEGLDAEGGRGIRFVRDACRLSQLRHNKVLLARVLTGECKTTQDTRDNDPKKTGKGQSLVDDVSTPTEFVIFDNEQSYPEYLITFAKTEDS